MLEQLNINLFLYINLLTINAHVLNELFIILAEYMPYLFILVLLSVWCWQRKLRLLVIQAGMAVILALLFSYAISLFYFHPRPFAMGLGFNLVEHAPDSSFPSDHTTFLFAIAWSFLSKPVTRTCAYALVCLAALSGMCRIIVGVHFPLDIMMAAAVAGCASLIIHKAFKKCF